MLPASASCKPTTSKSAIARASRSRLPSLYLPGSTAPQLRVTYSWKRLTLAPARMLQLSTRRTRVSAAAAGREVMVPQAYHFAAPAQRAGRHLRARRCAAGGASIGFRRRFDALDQPQADLLEFGVVVEVAAAVLGHERRVRRVACRAADHQRGRGVDAPGHFRLLVGGHLGIGGRRRRG